VLTRGEICLLKLGMDRLRHGLISRRGSGRGHMSDQVRALFLTGFAQMDFVAGPPCLALFAVARLLIIRRVDELVARRKLVVASPVELPLDPDVVLDPNAAQDLDRRDFTQPGRGICGVDIC
jgi:hypothetical protein